LAIEETGEENITINDPNITEIESYEVIVDFPTVDFTPRMTNHLQNDSENKRIGDLGELLVINFEKEKLLQAGKSKLAEKIKHTAKDKGDGTGYDIESFDTDGNKIFIEVKTTRNDFSQMIHITRNELERSIKEKDNYFLYRVYNFDDKTGRGVIWKRKGDLSDLCKYPSGYKASIRKK